MAFRIEWRRRSEGDETILVIEEGSNDVVKTWQADTDLLQQVVRGPLADAPGGGADDPECDEQHQAERRRAQLGGERAEGAQPAVPAALGAG